MGTMIDLRLSGVPIDFGKNHYWTSHAWLFPPNSTQDVDYHYARMAPEGDTWVTYTETRPGLRARLRDVRSRIAYLGYSLAETRDRFDAALERWNRTYDLTLSFDRYLEAVKTIDFSRLTDEEQRKYDYDVRKLIVTMLHLGNDRADIDNDTMWSLEDFVFERVPVHVLVRCLAENPINLDLPLTWGYQDLVDSGWETFETLMDIDRPITILNLVKLFGQLQDHSGLSVTGHFDKWLAAQGLPRETPYIKVGSSGAMPPVMHTLPTALRHMIHHPENRNQVLTDAALRDGLEELVRVAKSVLPLS